MIIYRSRFYPPEDYMSVTLCEGWKCEQNIGIHFEAFDIYFLVLQSDKSFNLKEINKFI